MEKKLLTLSLLLVVLLAACQSSAANPTEIPAQGIDTPQPSEPTPSLTVPPLPEVTSTPQDEQVQVEGESYCTVVSRQATPGPTEQSIVPPVRDTDWAQGQQDAMVTIIEYGDFQ
jgi:uncharacterized lipoprotein